MPAVVVSPPVRESLRSLVETHEPPPDTTVRIRKLLEPLSEFPEMGSALHGRWKGFRYLLGPWPWMLIVYAVDRERELVIVTTIQDARRATAASGRADR